MAVKPLIEPPTGVMSLASKLAGASLKVKVTTELLLASLSEGSTMSTATVGLSRSMVTLSEPPTPALPAASCQAVPTVTEPVPEKPSVAVKIAV